jgi:hypothetical protein
MLNTLFQKLLLKNSKGGTKRSSFFVLFVCLGLGVTVAFDNSVPVICTFNSVLLLF